MMNSVYDCGSSFATSPFNDYKEELEDLPDLLTMISDDPESFLPPAPSSPPSNSNPQSMTSSFSNNNHCYNYSLFGVIQSTQEILDCDQSCFSNMEPMPLGPGGARPFIERKALPTTSTRKCFMDDFSPETSSPDEFDDLDIGEAAFFALHPLLNQEFGVKNHNVFHAKEERPEPISNNTIDPSWCFLSPKCEEKRTTSSRIDRSPSPPTSAMPSRRSSDKMTNHIHLHRSVTPEKVNIHSTCLNSEEEEEESQEHLPVFLHEQEPVEQWNERFQDLLNFRARRGHCLVPYNFSQNPKLAQWVQRQRYQYAQKQLKLPSTLTLGRQLALETMGFVWESESSPRQQQSSWMERFNSLKAFKEKFGHCNVREEATFCEGSSSLASWVKCQRRQCKMYLKGFKSTMTPQRYAQLEYLGLTRGV